MFSSKLYLNTARLLMASGVLIITKKLVVELLLPLNVATNAIGTFGLLLGFFAMTGIFIYQRESGGMFILIAYIVQWFGLAAVSGVDYAKNYILPFLGKSETQALLAGPTKPVFLVSALLFLAGVILFSIATLRTRIFTPVPIVFYMIGFTLYSISFALPANVARGGEVLGAIGIFWWGFELAMQVQQQAKLATAQQVRPMQA
jgi:hypothetical protein